MDDAERLRRAGWAGIASVLLLAGAVALGTPVSVDVPGVADSVIIDNLSDGTKQAMAGISLPMLSIGAALLLWFAAGLRSRLEQLSGGDPLLHAVVPAAALYAGLAVTGASITVASAISALTDEFTLDADTARVLGAAGLIIALTGLGFGAALVVITTRITRKAGALSTWATWASYVVVFICFTGFWTAGMGSVAFGLWIVGTSIGMLRSPQPEAGQESPASR